MKRDKAVYVLFDNTMEDHSIVDTVKMKLLLGKRANPEVSHEGIKQ
jgi:uncharacterized protein YecE (DUF72 family)